MKLQRVSSGQLFELADTISNLSSKAGAASQQNVTTNLDSALASVLDAAKSAAFNEAHDRHTISKMNVPTESEGVEP